jgi:hypothetical protein
MRDLCFSAGTLLAGKPAVLVHLAHLCLRSKNKPSRVPVNEFLGLNSLGTGGGGDHFAARNCLQPPQTYQLTYFVVCGRSKEL